jgi:hypothetical protein
VNVRLLGGYFLWAVLRKFQEQRKFLGYFFTLLFTFALIFTKKVWATFWATNLQTNLVTLLSSDADDDAPDNVAPLHFLPPAKLLEKFC